MTDDKTLALWILSLSDAGQDCRNKIAAINHLQQLMETSQPKK